MKNLKYFPFERNRYYYGKLLTEQDFINEQKYLNDKRRLGNRFLQGVGVAAGLNVVLVDEKSISVEAGLAYDFSGRELVVDTPVTRRLSTVDGFDSIMERSVKNYVYLCIEYDEKEISPAHNVAGDTLEQKQEYDKYQEGYRLYLTDQEPDSVSSAPDEFYEQTRVLYRDASLLLTQTIPLYIQEGTAFETKIRLENFGADTTVSMRLREELSCVSCAGKKELEFILDETSLERGGSTERTFSLKTQGITDGEASFRIRPENLEISGERSGMHPEKEVLLTASIGAAAVFEELKSRYYQDVMEDAIRENYPQGIYLARIYLVGTGKTYLIDRIDAMPFSQYVYSGSLMAGMLHWTRKEIEQLRKDVSLSNGTEENSSRRSTQAEGSDGWRAEGTVEIRLGIGGKRGQRFFSHEIFHGLGLGNVRITLSLTDGKRAVYGSQEIFEDVEPKAELAASLDMSRGCFVIGVRMIEATSIQTMQVHWTAERFSKAEEKEHQDRRLYIRPGHVEMKVRESVYLEAVCEDYPGMTVIWRVKTPDGGTVTGDGLYTAPNMSGVYEVTAQCQDAPELRSSLFIVVRE